MKEPVEQYAPKSNGSSDYTTEYITWFILEIMV